MFNEIHKKLQTLLDSAFYTKQLETLFFWIGTKYEGQKCIVYTKLPLEEGFFTTKNNKTIKLKRRRAVKADIVVCQNGNFNNSLDSLKSTGIKTEAVEWKVIFLSYDLEVWENTTCHKIPPIRFGLSHEEKNDLLSIARRSASNFLNGIGNNQSNVISHKNKAARSRFTEKATVCVALWIEGQLRGSFIIRDKPLCEAIIQGSTGACRDNRFKPVASAELEKARIEISIMSDLRVPLTRKAIRENRIDPTLGYCIEKSNKVGWYVPEVFNAMKFSSLTELTNSLATHKAKMSSLEAKDAVVSSFMVEDFIEAKDKRDSLDLDGPVVKKAHDDTKEFDKQSALVNFGAQAAEQILRIQESDGNIPPVIDLLTGQKKQIDFCRLTCASWALALFGKTIGDKRFITSAENGIKYLSKYIYDHPSLSLETRMCTLIYLGRAAAVLQKTTDLEKTVKFVSEYATRLKQYQPILFANIASFCADNHYYNSAFLDMSIRFAQEVERDFESKLQGDIPIHLAQYPELIPAFLGLFSATCDSKYKEKAERISLWFRNNQLANGAFPSWTTGILSPYTRGTSKVFEVLSIQYEKNKDVVLKTLNWLRQMQYSDENAYFIKPDLRQKIVGGLRHDYLNQDVWIDGTAHTLIGLSRILEQLKKTL